MIIIYCFKKIQSIFQIAISLMKIRLNLNGFFVSVNSLLNAIDAFEKAIKIKSDFHDAYRNMGVAYNGLGKYQEAIDACKKAIEIKISEPNLDQSLALE
jgi:tetratricopeptide (TPR) repeat protein